MTTRRIDIGGIELEVHEQGAGGRPLLLAHGYTGSRADWEDWTGRLADAGWHVVTFDNRGHGNSGKPEREADYSLAIFADDTLALADAIGFDRFTLLGHSMGGMFAQLVAIKAPERLHGLILMDTHHGPLRAADDELIELAITTARSDGMDAIGDFMDAMGDDGPLTTEAHQRMLRERPDRKVQSSWNLRSCSPAMYAALMIEIADHADRLDLLGALDVPTLVIVGEQDKPFRGASDRLAAAIDGARLAVIADGGHCPQIEAPDLWWDEVSTFLEPLAASIDSGGPTDG